MQKIFISDIKDRSQVDSVFLVKEKITAMAKNGKPYLTLKLMDKSGDVDGKVWDNIDSMGGTFEKDDFIAIRSKATIYLGKMQLVITDIQRVPEEAVTLGDFLPETERSIAGMTEELGTLIGTIRDPHLQRLLLGFYQDQPFMACYRTAPAAKGMHHVYLGGLLEHSLAVARLVDQIVPLYQGLNRDLLITGAILHDVGKVREMSYLRSFDYTDEGKLIGHITIGVEMLHERIITIDGFPPQLGMLLKHIILSHHGQYEYGSPKRPKTIEATILNYLDDLDSKINGINTHMKKEPDSPSVWTSYHRLYDRYYYKNNLLADRGEALPSPREEEAAVALPEESPQKRQAREEKERKGFQNNPFVKLQGENLDLF